MNRVDESVIVQAKVATEFKKNILPKQNELQNTKYSNIPQIPFC